MKETVLARHSAYKGWDNMTAYLGNDSIKNYAFFLERGVKKKCTYFVKKHKNAEKLLSQLNNLQFSVEREARKVIRLNNLKGFARVLEKINFIINKVKYEKRQTWRGIEKTKTLRDLLRVKDSAKKLTTKKVLYEDMRINKLKANPGKIIGRSEDFYRKTKTKNKTNRILISKASHPGRFSNYQKIDLGNHISANLRKKKILTLFVFILSFLTRRYIFRKLPSQKIPQEALSAIAKDLLSEVNLRLGALVNGGCFFKKTQKNKKLLRASAILKASNFKVRNKVGYRCLQTKKRRAYVIKKLKKHKLIWGLLVKIKRPVVKNNLRRCSWYKSKGKEIAKSHFWKSIVFSQDLRKKALRRRLKEHYLKTRSISGKMRSRFFYKIKGQAKVEQKAKKKVLLGFFIANKQLKRYKSLRHKKTTFAPKLITYSRLPNKVSRALLMKRFFMYNALYHTRFKQRLNKSDEVNEDTYLFFRKFSYYKNNQGLISIFKLTFFLALKKKKFLIWWIACLWTIKR